MEQYSFRRKNLEITNKDLQNAGLATDKYNFNLSLNIEARSDDPTFGQLSDEDKDKYFNYFAKNVVIDYLKQNGFENFYNHFFHNFALKHPYRKCDIDLFNSNNQPVSTLLTFDVPTINSLKISKKEDENKVLFDYNRKSDIYCHYNVFNEKPFKIPETNVLFDVSNNVTANKEHEDQPITYKYNIVFDAVSASESRTNDEIKDCLTQSIIEYFKENHTQIYTDKDKEKFIRKYLQNNIPSKCFNFIDIKGTAYKLNASTNKILSSKPISASIGSFMLHEEHGIICS